MTPVRYATGYENFKRRAIDCKYNLIEAGGVA